MLDMCGIIRLLRLITSASSLTTLTLCYIISKPVPLARDESQQPSRRNGAGFVLLSGARMDLDVNAMVQRFWDKADRSGKCWIWQGWKDKGGYGMYPWDGAIIRAHRLAFELTYGSIPKGLLILHECDNSLCINPAHLRAGTAAENNQDTLSRERRTYENVRGERNGRARITNEQARHICDLYATGNHTQIELAHMFNIDQTSISRVVRMGRWYFTEQSEVA